MVPELQTTDHDRAIVTLMEAAYEAGFTPRFEPAMAIASENTTGRHILLVQRGMRNGYEPFMRDAATDIRLGPLFDKPDYTCVTIRPVSAACDFAYRWLNGENHINIIANYRVVGGRPFILEPDGSEAAK